jgi:hypothetical protein
VENQQPPKLWRQLLIAPKAFYELIKAGLTIREAFNLIIAILKIGR